MGKEQIKIVCENRKARHDYFIHETFEAGVALFGTEVKSVRAGRMNLKDSYGVIKNGELFLEGMHISPYEQGNIFNRDALRPKKLLMHKGEILKLFGKSREKGFTIIPLRAYLKRGRVKIEIALASGKHNYDKRRALADKAVTRDVARAIKETA